MADALLAYRKRSIADATAMVSEGSLSRLPPWCIGPMFDDAEQSQRCADNMFRYWRDVLKAYELSSHQLCALRRLERAAALLAYETCMDDYLVKHAEFLRKASVQWHPPITLEFATFAERMYPYLLNVCRMSCASLESAHKKYSKRAEVSRELLTPGEDLKRLS